MDGCFLSFESYFLKTYCSSNLGFDSIFLFFSEDLNEDELKDDTELMDLIEC